MGFIERTMVESCGSYEFAMEPMTDDLIAQLRPLHGMHWQETEAYRHGSVLNPAYDVLQALNQVGRYVIFTCRKDGELVGNCMVHLFTSTHTQNLEAKEDTLFILPAHRVPRLAPHFIKFSERCLQTIGARSLTITAKIGTRSEHLFPKMGYRVVATEYHKQFGEPHVLV